MKSLKFLLKGVPDPHGKQGLQHPLEALLELMLLSLLSGHRCMLAAFHLGHNLSRSQPTPPGFRRHLKSPCHATLTELLGIPDPDAMAQALGNLTSAPGTRSDHELSPGHLSMDGKTLRSSKYSEGKSEHVLSTFRAALKPKPKSLENRDHASRQASDFD